MRRQISSILFILILLGSSSASAQDLIDLNLEDLMQIKMTSAGRKEQNVMDIPAAAYVLTSEDIANSGATSVPQALRLVPGLSVRQVSSNTWNISSRGFNSTFSNKLLVQIDGRSVYTQAYSGVYWDMQNLMLEDVERIEVIRGPGATLWGANAVNGIINIITKDASDTQGGLISVAGGNHEQLIASARYGGQLNENTYGRIYLHKHDVDSYEYLADDSDANDDWQVAQAGFRLDGDVGMNNSWTLQGDLYNNDMNQQIDFWVEHQPPFVAISTAKDDFSAKGANILARWQNRRSESEETNLQLYYDYMERQEIYIGQDIRTLDVDFQQRLQPLEKHDLVWGLGYRYTHDEYDNTDQGSVFPEQDSTSLISGFIQDEIRLIDDQLWLTAGLKVEHNDFTGNEFQPTLKLLWKPQPQHSIWTSVSRAVRTPSRIESGGSVLSAAQVSVSDMPFLVPLYVAGSDEMESENVIAYELGYRFLASERFSIDSALFYNSYSDLRSFNLTTDAFGTSTLTFDNGDNDGYSYGLELTLKWIPVDWITTEFNYTLTQMSVSQDIDGTDESIDEGNSTPQHQLATRLSFDLGNGVKLNGQLRYVDSVKQSGLINITGGSTVIDSYTEMDANIRWQVRDNLELALVGQNLLNSEHLEMISDYYIAPIDIGRSVYAKATWTF